MVAVLVAVAIGVPGRGASAAPSEVRGQGSTYVALAMQQWVADAQTSGLRVSYTPTGSPQGLQAFASQTADFAGTEAEFSALGSNTSGQRGYQYVPDVAGAIAVMYNADDAAGRKVDYLQLTRYTVARIFMGYITHWDDPQISADNKGLVLPHEPITVVYRGGQSGTTALFYDFVAHMDPSGFQDWTARNQLPTRVRIIQLDTAPAFAPITKALNGSDLIAQHVASNAGKWSIAYDEFGYAKTYNATAAYVQNAAGEWVLPYAANISAALESAQLRPDLSQELSGVYNSANPLAYPLSAYSYVVTQCATAADRDTCRGPYANAGAAETLTTWLRYVACEGQVNMARIGYSPLPPHLSQEMANSIARMNGGQAEQLNADNCANPRFRGNFGGGDEVSPPPPLANIPEGGLAPEAQAEVETEGGGSGPGAAGPSGPSGDTGGAIEVAAGTEQAVGLMDGKARAVGGGSSDWRDGRPIAYGGPPELGAPLLPLVVLVGFLAVPPLVGLVVGRRRRARISSHV